MKAPVQALAAIALVGLCTFVIGCNSDGVTTPTTGEAPLVPPTNVRVVQNISGTATIEWDRVSNISIRGYNVYRLDMEATAIQKLTVNPTDDDRYVDATAASDGRYEYRVTSVNQRGDESVYASAAIEMREWNPRLGHFKPYE